MLRSYIRWYHRTNVLFISHIKVKSMSAFKHWEHCYIEIFNSQRIVSLKSLRTFTMVVIELEKSKEKGANHISYKVIQVLVYIARLGNWAKRKMHNHLRKLSNAQKIQQCQMYVTLKCFIMMVARVSFQNKW